MLMTTEWSKGQAAEPEELLRWYIVRTYAGAEWQLRKGLLKRGMEAFMPYFVDDVRRDRWQHGVIKALFPGYIFVGLEPDQHSDEVRSVNGSMGVLKVNERPVEVSPRQMEKLRLQAADEFMASWGAKEKVVRVNVGDIVAVPEGYPFEGIPVEIEAIDKRGQITASLGSLGDVKFPLSALTEACRRPLKAMPQSSRG